MENATVAGDSIQRRDELERSRKGFPSWRVANIIQQMIKRPIEGTVSMGDSTGIPVEGRWYLENGVVTLYVGDFGPFAALVGGSTPESIARHLMREFLDGRQTQEARIASSD